MIIKLGDVNLEHVHKFKYLDTQITYDTKPVTELDLEFRLSIAKTTFQSGLGRLRTTPLRYLMIATCGVL